MNGNMPEVEECNLDGQRIKIRPITVDDQDLETDFINNLSAEARHYRFFGGVTQLSAQRIKSFCTVDGQDSMAFIATVDNAGKETEIGVSRYTKADGSGAHEMAVTIADNWQDKGLDRLLTEHLITYARLHGVSNLYAMEMNDNTHMSHLAAELGMLKKSDPDDIHQIIYSLALK